MNVSRERIITMISSKMPFLSLFFGKGNHRRLLHIQRHSQSLPSLQISISTTPTCSVAPNPFFTKRKKEVTKKKRDGDTNQDTNIACPACDGTTMVLKQKCTVCQDTQGDVNDVDSTTKKKTDNENNDDEQSGESPEATSTEKYDQEKKERNETRHK